MTTSQAITTSDGTIIGYIVSVPLRGSFFVQTRRVRRGSCYNVGVNARYMKG